MKYIPGPYLSQIDFPKDLREKFSYEDLPNVAEDVRQYIIDVVSEIGNSHFGASMGAVDLTVAIHYAFNTPKDQLIWDVGHQAYGHKILTGRKAVFPTNRKKDGISGFPKREESEYDTFGVGHSSTSISAALGMAVASNYKNDPQKQHIAVIGDGALTGGLAFEGLNHAGFETDANLLVILNDNCMSIDPNVGALKEYLAKTTTSKPFSEVKKRVKEEFDRISNFGSDEQEIISKVSERMQIQSNLFESLNFNYFGPVDGHDVIGLTKILEELKEIPGPKILHCITKKGAGYKYSEIGDPTLWHAPGAFDKETGEIKKKISTEPKPPKYQDVFGHTLLELAEQNDKIMGITPAMPTGSSLNIMMKAMPERTFDVGIAEQHAVTFSAGLATQGLIPFCNIYSSFMQRAFDQVIHDVALQNLNVVFCLDRAGVVGADGPTHHGAFDMAYMRSIPNMVVSAPMNESELRNLMFTAQQENQGPFVIRYPRGRGVSIDWKTEMESIKIGTGRKLSEGKDIAILSIGHPGNFVQDAIQELKNENISVAHYDLRFVKPLDTSLLKEVFSQFDKIVTVEDGCLVGGFGSAILEFMSNNQFNSQVMRLGIPDEFVEQGTQQELQAECGFDKNAIVSAVNKMLNS